MTMPTRIERNLPAILADLSMAPVPDYLDDVFGQSGQIRQRPAWTFPGRWLPMADVARLRAVAPAPPWRLFALGLLILALIAAALLAAGAQRRPAPPFGPAKNGQIVFASKGDVYAADPATGVTRLLVGGPDVDSAPGYSPDGTRIAFIRKAQCCPNRVDLVVTRDDGSGVRTINASPLAEETWANWTPDSRHLAIIAPTSSGSQVLLLDADGREAPEELALGLETDNLVFRPPDGREIAFRSLVDGKWGIFVVNADGSDVHALQKPSVPAAMDLHAQSMVYSPDGSRLYYQSYNGPGARQSDGCCQLWVMNADGSNPHPVEENRAAWSGNPSVSPDGRWVSYWYVFGYQPHHLKVAPADGSYEQ
jgi:Tol biopolymer transport system component